MIVLRFLSPCPAFSSRLAGGLEVELQQWWLDLGTTDHCHPGQVYTTPPISGHFAITTKFAPLAALQSLLVVQAVQASEVEVQAAEVAM